MCESDWGEYKFACAVGDGRNKSVGACKRKRRHRWELYIEGHR